MGLEADGPFFHLSGCQSPCRDAQDAEPGRPALNRRSRRFGGRGGASWFRSPGGGFRRGGRRAVLQQDQAQFVGFAGHHLQAPLKNAVDLGVEKVEHQADHQSQQGGNQRDPHPVKDLFRIEIAPEKGQEYPPDRAQQSQRPGGIGQEIKPAAVGLEFFILLIHVKNQLIMHALGMPPGAMELDQMSQGIAGDGLGAFPGQFHDRRQ